MGSDKEVLKISLSTDKQGVKRTRHITFLVWCVCFRFKGKLWNNRHIKKTYFAMFLTSKLA